MKFNCTFIVSLADLDVGMDNIFNIISALYPSETTGYVLSYTTNKIKISVVEDINTNQHAFPIRVLAEMITYKIRKMEKATMTPTDIRRILDMGGGRTSYGCTIKIADDRINIVPSYELIVG